MSHYVECTQSQPKVSGDAVLMFLKSPSIHLKLFFL